MVKKIDKLTNSIIENGMYRFFTSVNALSEKLVRAQLPNEEIAVFGALTMKQLKGLFVFLGGLWAISLFVFAYEIIAHQIVWSLHKFI